MAYTQLDSDFLNKKHSLVHQITKELLDALEANELSKVAGQELAIEVLEAKDLLRTNEDILAFIAKLSSSYPFLKKLQTEMLSNNINTNIVNELSEKDSQKLEQIQDQLTKLSETA